MILWRIRIVYNINAMSSHEDQRKVRNTAYVLRPSIFININLIAFLSLKIILIISCQSYIKNYISYTELLSKAIF